MSNETVIGDGVGEEMCDFYIMYHALSGNLKFDCCLPTRKYSCSDLLDQSQLEEANSFDGVIFVEGAVNRTIDDNV